MRRFGSAVLILAVLASLLLHFLFLRFIVFDRSTETESEISYEVTLKYYKPPAEKSGQQNKKRILKKREDPLKLPSEDVKLPVEQPMPEVLEVADEEDSEETEEEQTGIEEAVQSEQQVQSEKQEGPSEADSPYAESIAGLRNNILKRKIYPQAARRRNIEGVVLVFLELNTSGELVDLRVIQSSGSKILDTAALSLIKKVLPYEHGLEKALSVEIPIRYSFSE